MYSSLSLSNVHDSASAGSRDLPDRRNRCSPSPSYTSRWNARLTVSFEVSRLSVSGSSRIAEHQGVLSCWLAWLPPHRQFAVGGRRSAGPALLRLGLGSHGRPGKRIDRRRAAPIRDGQTRRQQTE